MRIVLIIFLTIIGAILLRYYGESRYLDGATTAFDTATQILKNSLKEITNHETAEQDFADVEKNIADGINSSSWSRIHNNSWLGDSPDDETSGGTKRDR